MYNQTMKTKVLNYTVIVEPDTETGTDKPGYTANCPTLGVADDGDTIEQALKNLQSLIKFHLESLAEEGEDIPVETSESNLLTKIQIPLKGKLSRLISPKTNAQTARS